MLNDNNIYNKCYINNSIKIFNIMKIKIFKKNFYNFFYKKILIFYYKMFEKNIKQKFIKIRYIKS